METRTSIKAKLYRRLNKNLGDFNVNLCMTTDFDNLPTSITKDGGRAYITITGINLPQLENCFVEYYGEWVTNKRYGLQFKADSYQIVPPNTEKGLVSFLSSKSFHGIGTKTATAIVEMFGKSTIDVIENSPNKLLTVKGCTPEKIKTITESYSRNQRYSKLAIFLGNYGISSDNIVKINDLFGAKSIEKIKEDPYLLQELRGIGFQTCDKIAKGLNVALDSYKRIKGGTIEIINGHIESTGDTYIGLGELVNKTLDLLNGGLTEKVITDEKIKIVLSSMKENNLISCVGKKCIFLKRFEEAEESSSSKLNNLCSKPIYNKKYELQQALDNYEFESNIKLSKKQQEAVINSLNNRVSIITGGPGTGKTTVLCAIIYCYKRLSHKPVILMAPTGKASSRMSEVTGEFASTIHSKLQIYDSIKSEPLPLEDGLIIVDESSMVDALLLDKLLKAIIHHNSQLLFVGDVDQLPSVGAGAVLQDMIDSKKITTSRLTDFFRQKEGSSVIENARLINMGDKKLIYDNDFELVEVADENEAINKIEELYKSEVKNYGIDNVALLSPLRRTQGRFACVSDSLNPTLQQVINPRLASYDSYCIINNTEYRVNDRVLQWKNNSETSNGDVGIIKDIKEIDGEVNVFIDWDNGKQTMENRETMADISLAYAISIHKSQGSEYSCVIIPLLSCQKCQLFKRNLLYTGVTRAKKKVIIVGDKKAIDMCITNTDSNRRNTLFARRLSLA